jgi:ribosomal protein S25
MQYCKKKPKHKNKHKKQKTKEPNQNNNNNNKLSLSRQEILDARLRSNVLKEIKTLQYLLYRMSSLTS